MDPKVFRMLDAGGQPIGGVAAPNYDEQSVTVVGCPYKDRREGRPMDTTALSAVTADWPAILQAARALSGPDATVHRAWRTTMALLLAPILRAQADPTPTPLVMSGAFKVALGYAQALTHLLLTQAGTADAPMAEQESPEQLFERLDRDGALLGKRHVCSGTPRMIAEMWRALAGGEAALPGPWSDIVGFESRLMWLLDQEAVAAARVLGGELHGSHTPWLFAQQGGDATRALRLFPSGAAPARLTATLAALE